MFLYYSQPSAGWKVQSAKNIYSFSNVCFKRNHPVWFFFPFVGKEYYGLDRSDQKKFVYQVFKNQIEEWEQVIAITFTITVLLSLFSYY